MSTIVSKPLAIILFLLVSILSAAEPWWNDAWEYRLPVTVIVGLTPGENPLAVVKIAAPEADLTSFRVLDGSGKEIPCAARHDAGGCRFVAWRLGRVQILEKLPYLIYFSTAPKAAVATVDIPLVLPGMNLLPNSDFALSDSNGDLAEWSPTSGYGVKAPWTDKTRASVRREEKDAQQVLALEDITLVGYVSPLQEEHQYELSYEAFVEEGSFALTAWMQEKDRAIPHYTKLSRNYKFQTPSVVPGAWNKSSASTFVYFDLASEKMRLNNKYLLKNTGGAYINLYCKGKVFLRNLRLQDITEAAGLIVRPEKIEKLPR